MVDFPANPTNGQQFTSGGITWTYDGVKWTLGGTSPIFFGDTPPANPVPGMLWWDSRSGQLFIWYVDSNSAAWVVAINLGTAGPQGEVGPQGEQGIEGPVGPVGPMGAVTIDALAYNGMQVNGSMDVSQEHGSAPVPGDGSYPVDQWIFAHSTASAGLAECAQVADAPPGLTNSIMVTVQTAQATMAADDCCYITQNIEGYRTARLAFGKPSAQPVSIGFWTKIHRPGTYSGSIRNFASGQAFRGYPFNFTQNASDTWEFKTATIPGDVTGEWATGNTSGLSLFFCLASGSTLLAPANAWVGQNVIGANGTTNGLAATTDTFQVTGVIVLPGIQLPDAAMAPLIMRPAEEEELKCERYFQFNGYGESGFAAGAGSMVFWHQPRRLYRAIPIMSLVTTSFYLESPPWAMGVNVTGGAVNPQHMTAGGGDYNLTGSFNQVTTAYYPASLLTPNLVKFDARINA